MLWAEVRISVLIICKFSNKWTCTRKKEVEGLSCGFEDYYPKEDKEYGLGIIYPSVEDIAQAIAKRDKAKIVPMGAYALNRLGLSTQMHMNVVFLTNGAPRRIKIGNGRGILFKHSSSGKNFAYKSELMMLVVTAMRTIGENKITDEERNVLVEHAKNVNDNDFKHDIKLAPAWVRKILITR